MTTLLFSGPDRRHRTRYRVRISFVLKSGEKEVRGITRNVSLLGISAYSDSPIDAALPVQCTLNLSESYGPLVVHGTIIRCEPLSQPIPDGNCEVGVFFKDFQGRGETILDEYLQKVGHQEEDAIKAGYLLLKQRQIARRKKKRIETIKKKRRQQARLRKKKLAQKKKTAAKKKNAKKGTKSSALSAGKKP